MSTFLRKCRTFMPRQRKFNATQQSAYERLSGTFCFPMDGDFSAVFPNKDRETVIEIGFGSGIATAQIAKENPGKNYLCFEVHKPGVANLLHLIEENSLENIRIVEGDALEFIEAKIPNETISAFHIFFPDPWPKKRHRKRRLVARPTTNLFAGKLRNDGYIYFVTDWQDYGEFALEELNGTEGLQNYYNGFASPQPWRPQTHFEKKGIDAGHHIFEIFFRKKQ